MYKKHNTSKNTSLISNPTASIRSGPYEYLSLCYPMGFNQINKAVGKKACTYTSNYMVTYHSLLYHNSSLKKNIKEYSTNPLKAHSYFLVWSTSNFITGTFL